jgi:hypothetical protein
MQIAQNTKEIKIFFIVPYFNDREIIQQTNT